MCNDPHYFNNLVPDFTSIQLGDGKLIYSRGRGTIGNLQNIYFVPELRYNLLSISYLRDLGFTVSFDTEGNVILTDSAGKNQLLGTYCDGLYRTTGHPIEIEIHHRSHHLVLFTNSRGQHY